MVSVSSPAMAAMAAAVGESSSVVIPSGMGIEKEEGGDGEDSLLLPDPERVRMDSSDVW